MLGEDCEMEGGIRLTSFLVHYLSVIFKVALELNLISSKELSEILEEGQFVPLKGNTLLPVAQPSISKSGAKSGAPGAYIKEERLSIVPSQSTTSLNSTQWQAQDIRDVRESFENKDGIDEECKLIWNEIQHGLDSRCKMLIKMAEPYAINLKLLKTTAFLKSMPKSRDNLTASRPGSKSGTSINSFS